MRDALKKQNKELTEAVDDKESSLGTTLYQLSAASPALAGQLVGSAGNVINQGLMGAINLANRGYQNLTGGKLVNTDIIQATDKSGNAQSMTDWNAARKKAEEDAVLAQMGATPTTTA